MDWLDAYAQFLNADHQANQAERELKSADEQKEAGAAPPNHAELLHRARELRQIASNRLEITIQLLPATVDELPSELPPK